MPLTNIGDLEALRMIDEEVGSITDAYLQRVTASLEPVADGEKSLGTLHDMTARRLYCASRTLHSKAA